MHLYISKNVKTILYLFMFFIGGLFFQKITPNEKAPNIIINTDFSKHLGFIYNVYEDKDFDYISLSGYVKNVQDKFDSKDPNRYRHFDVSCYLKEKICETIEIWVSHSVDGVYVNSHSNSYPLDIINSKIISGTRRGLCGLEVFTFYRTDKKAYFQYIPGTHIRKPSFLCDAYYSKRTFIESR